VSLPLLALAALAAVEIPVRFTAEAKVPANGALRTAIEQRFEPGEEEEVELPKTRTRMTLRNCADFVALGDAPPVTVEVINQRHALYVMAHCRALGMLNGARPAVRSFLGDFQLSSDAPGALPAELRIDPASSEARRRRRSKPWRTVDRRLRASLTQPHVLHLDGRSDETFVREYGRGDVNGDGLEDVVVRTEGFLPGGTYEEHAAYALTRTSPRGPLMVVARWRGAY
jgi:hypothetical protein